MSTRRYKPEQIVKCCFADKPKTGQPMIPTRASGTPCAG